MKKILFIGSNPATERNILEPFVGTKSGNVLREWISLLNELGADFGYGVVNASDVITSKGKQPKISDLNLSKLKAVIDEYKPTHVVALGKYAGKACSKLGLTDYFVLPHPSGKNRTRNDHQYVSHRLLQLYCLLAYKNILR